MAYATRDDLRMFLRDRRIAELSADSGEAPAEEFLDTLLARVSEEVDGYLLNYGPPIVDAKVKTILREHVLKITVYRLLLRGLVSGDATADAKEAVEHSYEWLKLVGKGEIALPVASAEPAIPAGETLTTAGGEENVFDKDPGTVL